MKAVMVSIQPKWVEKICCGKKTIEVRKTRPQLDTPFKCYIYCTKASKSENVLLFENSGECVGFGDYRNAGRNFDGTAWHIGNGKVIGEFVCDRIDYWQYHYKSDVMHIADMSELSCVSIEDLLKYSNGGETTIYGWHISDLVIYDEPKLLGEFFTPIGKRPSYMLERPPQSWQYVEEKENKDE